MVMSCSLDSMSNMYKIGYAEDIHRLVDNRKLILGGVEIPFEKGLLGHSDADVIFHAVGESILGALAKGDLGTHFPDNSDATLNMDSKLILFKCKDLLKEDGYIISNIDVSVILERPKLKPYINSIRENIAKHLDIDINNVSVKAGTNEGLDEIGKGLAIKAISICLIEKI